MTDFLMSPWFQFCWTTAVAILVGLLTNHLSRLSERYLAERSVRVREKSQQDAARRLILLRILWLDERARFLFFKGRELHLQGTVCLGGLIGFMALLLGLSPNYPLLSNHTFNSVTMLVLLILVSTVVAMIDRHAQVARDLYQFDKYEAAYLKLYSQFPEGYAPVAVVS